MSSIPPNTWFSLKSPFEYLVYFPILYILNFSQLLQLLVNPLVLKYYISFSLYPDFGNFYPGFISF